MARRKAPRKQAPFYPMQWLGRAGRQLWRKSAMLTVVRPGFRTASRRAVRAPMVYTHGINGLGLFPSVAQRLH